MSPSFCPSGGTVLIPTTRESAIRAGEIYRDYLGGVWREETRAARLSDRCPRGAQLRKTSGKGPRILQGLLFQFEPYRTIRSLISFFCLFFLTNIFPNRFVLSYGLDLIGRHRNLTLSTPSLLHMRTTLSRNTQISPVQFSEGTLDGPL
jgi:hypothetical protein